MNFHTLKAMVEKTEKSLPPDVGGSMASYAELGDKIRRNPDPNSVFSRTRYLQLGHIAVADMGMQYRGEALEAWCDDFAKQKLGPGHKALESGVRMVAHYLKNNSEPFVFHDGKWMSLLSYARRYGLQAGNGKLPFMAYSEMPLVTCPGAGGGKEDMGGSWGAYKKTPVQGCANWCYSFKAIRNITPVWRWFRLTLSHTMHGREHIEAVMQGMEASGTRIMRLFVDGDFRSKGHLADWMTSIGKRPGITVYGYSKSWRELLDYDRSGKPWPSNYVMNVSSGSRYGDEDKARVMELPCSRGEFVAVNIELIYEELKRSGRIDPASVEADREMNETMNRNAKAWAAKHNAAVDAMWAKPGHGGLTDATVREDTKILGSHIVQAVEGLYLQRAMNLLYPSAERTRAVSFCPAECGSCPSQMRPDWGAIREALATGNEAEFMRLVAKPWPMSSSTERVHRCGNAKVGSKIVIPVH